MNDTERRLTRVAAYALCVREGAMLLVRIAPGATATSDGMWTLPGGGLDFGEHPRDAVLRELAEETGLAGAVDSLTEVDAETGTFVLPEDDAATAFHVIRILYRVRILGGKLRDEIDGSSDACAWVGPDELEGLPLVDVAQLGARITGLLPWPAP